MPKEELGVTPDPRAQGERQQLPHTGVGYLKGFSPEDSGCSCGEGKSYPSQSRCRVADTLRESIHYEVGQGRPGDEWCSPSPHATPMPTVGQSFGT